MIVVKVWCLPKVLSAGQFDQVLEDYRAKIVDSVLSVSGLKINDRHRVTVIFPSDFLSHTDASALVVEIISFDETSIRNIKVRNMLSECVGKTVQSFYPNAFVDCIITYKSG